MKLLTHSALRRGGAATAGLAAAGLALAACGTSGSSGNGATGTSTGSPAANTSTSSSSGSGGSTSTTTSNSVPFPVGVGNTWVYKSVTELGTSTKVVNKMIAVKSVSGGQQVTMQTTLDGATTTYTYVFHPDGSITYPFNQLGSDVKLLGGSVEWPSASAIDSGQATHSTLKMQLTEGSQKSDVTAHVTVKGGGTATVTVPAGTYTATIVEMTDSFTVLGHAGTITVKTYLANNVGPVQSEAAISEGGVNEIVSDQKLVSFTKG
jgi:hypothetical protein